MLNLRATIALGVCLMAASVIAQEKEQSNTGSTAQAVDAAGREFFESHIRPIIVGHCYQCHSGQSIKLRADLRLDSRVGLLKGGEGGAVIVPGEPDQSRLIQAIRWTDPDFQMPPKEKLSTEQIEKIEQWVRPTRGTRRRARFRTLAQGR
jgi:mono/diheme cytochrome c family protein